LTCNAEMGPTEVREFCQTDASGEKLLKAAVQQLHLSARAYHRVLKLARTIADLAGSEMIAANHVAEAVQYRPRVGMSEIVVDFAKLPLAQLPQNPVLGRYLRCHSVHRCC
jgi:predicted ATPase with chaperone activity